MDDADQAQRILDRHLRSSLNARQTGIAPFSGSCLFCEEPVENARFCGPDCRSDYEDQQAAKLRAGRLRRI